MSVVAVDTSVVIAALMTWHEHHSGAFGLLNDVLEGGDELLIPLPALIETYAVMTRLPAPHRLSPLDAFGLVSGALRSCAKVVGLAENDVWSFLEDLTHRNVAGGATYDAAIVACAERSDATRILTLNARHFERLVSDGMEVVVPRDAAVSVEQQASKS